MDQAFWLERWRKNQIRFHENAPNALLSAYFQVLHVRKGGRVFVPLCGRSTDLMWLRDQGFEVMGVELSRLAVEQFFTEHGLEPDRSFVGPLERFEVDGITLFLGDLYDLDHMILGPVDAVYDRAALVAFPPQMRAAYAAHVVHITEAAPQFVVTFDYDQSRVQGPPFSVSAQDMQLLYGTTYALESVGGRDYPGGLKGGCPARECVWALRGIDHLAQAVCCSIDV